MRKVITVKVNNNYTLELTFSGGSERRFDVTPYLERGIFTELQDKAYFKRVRLAFGTVQWPNEQDFSPDTLYLESTPTTLA